MAKKVQRRSKSGNTKKEGRKNGRSSKASSSTLRFAHPFFTPIPPEHRAVHAAFGDRLTTHIKGTLHPIPRPTGNAVMTLADVIGKEGANEIAASGRLSFHTVGDTGKRMDSPQGDVAEAMAKDFDVAHPGSSPAFFFHLGDVVYGHHKDQSYRQEFYEPYIHYPGKIIAIPGNHDGEVFPSSDPQSLKAFQDNFCSRSQSVPAIAGSIFRQTMNQPGVYWLLDAPFVDVVGLYSNSAENPGYISGQIPGQLQSTWLVNTLKRIAKERAAGKRKALIIATHHPPFTSGGHSPSDDMLKEIDAACQSASVMPDFFLSGHAHNYQRYTRFVQRGNRTLEIPYLVVGTGGFADSNVPEATGSQTGDHVFVKSRKGFGYALITVDAQRINCQYTAVDGASRQRFDTVTVNLATSKVS